MKGSLRFVGACGLLLVGLAACVAEEATPVEEEPPVAPMIEIPNALVVQGGILNGGQPDEQALRQAAEAGYRSIVNMRGPGEEGSLEGEADLVAELGMKYVALPIADAEALNENNARALAELMSDRSLLPAMVHCRSGNRVGILLALKAFYVDGVEGPAALEYGKANGARRIPENVHAILGTEPEPRTEDPTP